MAVINVDDVYILGETGEQVDKVTGLFTKDENTTNPEKAFAQLNIGTAGSNRNLLDNPFFQVNQRSFTTSTGNTYTVDRWIKSGNATVTLSNGIIVFDASSATSSYNFFSQRLAQDLIGRTVTLSLMTDDGTIYSKSGEIPARASSAQTAISLTISTGVFLEFTVSASSAAYTASIDVVLRNGRGPLNIKAVKLELGSVSTLANDAPPNYETELLKCRAAQLMIKNGAYNYLSVGISSYVSGTSARIYIPTPTPMWAASMKSAVPITGTLYLIGNGQAITVTALTLRGVLDTGVYVEATLQTSVSAAYNVYNLSMGSNATILIDCNL